MPTKRTAALATALACAFAGGPALAAVAGHTTASSTTTSTTSTTSTTTTTPPPVLLVCLGSVRRVIAARLGVRASRITDRQFLATNGMPQCNYLIAHARRGGPRGKVVVTANVDNGPQAHWRLMRKVVEATQIFGPVPKGFRPPIGIHGLGANASWFPALDQLMAINITDKYLMTVGVIWRGSTQAEKIAITRAVIVVYRHIAKLQS
jgi:hypothetical protein